MVFERSGYVSYANCGLPYYIGGVITDQEELTLQTPESFWRAFPGGHAGAPRGHSHPPGSGRPWPCGIWRPARQFEESYDKLLLSPGARPTQPGAARRGARTRLFTLRTVEDTLRIQEFIATAPSPSPRCWRAAASSALELAENLREPGHRRHRGPAAPPADESPGRGHGRLPPRQAAATRGAAALWAARWRALPQTVTAVSMCC